MPVRKYRHESREVNCCMKYVLFVCNTLLWVSVCVYVNLEVYLSVLVDLIMAADDVRLFVHWTNGEVYYRYRTLLKRTFLL